MSAFIALLVFAATSLVDGFFVLYTKSVVASHPARAATAGSAIHLINAFAVIEYTRDWRYVFLVASGSWFGTYVTLKWGRTLGGVPGS